MSDKKNTGSESAMGLAILAAVFVALGYLIWWHKHAEIRSAIRWLRYGEMWLMSFFKSDDYTVEWKGQAIKHNELMEVARNLPTEEVTGEFLHVLSTVAMAPYIPVFMIFCGCFAVWALFWGPGSEHRKKYDITSLIKKQAGIFPIISPFINYNPAKGPPRAPGSPVPAELPLFAEALGPEEWVVYNEIPIVDKKIDEEATTKAFAKQLGPRWRGFKALSPYKQVMLAAFCLKASRKRADSDTMMGRLARCWSEKGGIRIDNSLLREARAVLSNTAISGGVLRKCNEHAWETTALLRALNTAREEGGVLAPAQFVWLRAVDRDLWYPLNNLGRQSLHTEAMGAMAHYKAEKLAQRPIPRIKVGDAVKSLTEYIGSPSARPQPQMDYSNSKKRGVKKVKNA